MLECESYLKDLEILACSGLLSIAFFLQWMKEWECFGELFFNCCHPFSQCFVHFVNRRACATYSLNPVLSQKITAFTLSLLGWMFSMDAYTSICAFGADTKHSLLVWILLPLMVTALPWSDISAYSTWKEMDGTNRLSGALVFKTVFTEAFISFPRCKWMRDK